MARPPASHDGGHPDHATHLRCVQLMRKGRFLVGEPYFEHGHPITVAGGKRFLEHGGKLALLAAGEHGRVGYLVEVLGGEWNLRSVMRGLLAERGAFGGAPPAGRELDALPELAQLQLDDLGDDLPWLDEREDLRDTLCVTIDPPDARDHDDAVGLEVAPDGGSTLWVHIADVAAFVPAGSPLDLRALELGCSVYVPGVVAPMLPPRLSGDLCSLREGVDRGCVSVRLTLSVDGEVEEVRFARTLVCSARRLTYVQVDALLARGDAIDPAIDEMLLALDDVTAKLRSARMRRGALDLALLETSVELDQEGRALRAVAEPESRSHRLVEECMLLANGAVGDRLERSQRLAIHRLHPDPDPASIEALLATLSRLDVPTPPAPEQMSPRDAARVAAAAAERIRAYTSASPRGAAAFPSLVLRSLQQAFYSASAGRHSGLATERYLHFTSPIRRYPDLVNHRSLLETIGRSAGGEPCAVPVAEAAAIASERERAAIDIERAGDRIALAHLVQKVHRADPDAVHRGEVVGMIGAGMFVRFAGAYEGFVPARTLGRGERHELDDDGLALVGTRSGERIRLGDTVTVRVHRVDRASGKVDLRRATAGAKGID